MSTDPTVAKAERASKRKAERASKRKDKPEKPKGRKRGQSPAPTVALAAQPQPTADPGKPGPAATNFDLLDGAFTKVRQARLVQLVVVGLVALAVVGVASRAVLIRFEAATLDAERVDLEAQLPTVQALLAQEANVGDLTRRQMETHLEEVGTELVTVLASDIPYNETVALLRNVVPPGAELSSVSFTGREVSFQVAIPGYQAANDLVSSLPASLAAMITELQFEWAGTSEGVTLTYTGKLTPRATTPRASLFASQLQLDLAKLLENAEPAPAEPEGGQP